ncbi:MAG: hypothetical protein H0W81_09475 [Chloroflexi bacterium]|nr:hypothetical protein [Chloroflexota bacterium]
MRDMAMTTDTDLWALSRLRRSGSYVVVGTGPWIFGKKVMLQAGVIDRIDTTERRVYVNRTKDQIQNAPEFDEANYRDEAYRTALGDYYGLRGGVGYRE